MSEDRDHAWLLARERGEPVDVPKETAAVYRRLEAMIRELPDEVPGEPATDSWRSRVLDAIDNAAAESEPPADGGGSAEGGPSVNATAPTPTTAGASAPDAADVAGEAVPIPIMRARSRRTWAIAAGGVAMAASVLLFVALRRDPQPPGEATLAVFTVQQGGDHRGTDASVGDKLVVNATLRGPGEIRVYGDAGEVIAQCRAATCGVGRPGLLSLTVPLTAPGTARAVLFEGEVPPARTFDEDVAAAQRAGVTVITQPPIRVR